MFERVLREIHNKLISKKPSSLIVPKGVVIKQNIFDGQWHSVDVTRDTGVISIILDSRNPVNLTVEINTLDVDLDGPVYIGGIDSEYTLGVDSGHNFIGCLQQIFYNKV